MALEGLLTALSHMQKPATPPADTTVMDNKEQSDGNEVKGQSEGNEVKGQSDGNEVKGQSEITETRDETFAGACSTDRFVGLYLFVF